MGGARAQLEVLWERKVEEVLRDLERWRARGAAGAAALSDDRAHPRRMDYASYRARGMQIGSGSAESAGTQLIAARLKGAGMIWDAAGAAAVAAVRAWLKRARWDEAVALRGVPRRSDRRKQARQAPPESATRRQATREPVHEVVKTEDTAQRSRRSADVLARVHTELAQQHGKHGWGQAWSVTRQRELVAQRAQASPTSIV